MRRGLALIDRLLARVVVRGDEGCWLWSAATVRGYGFAFTPAGRSKLVHRVVYEELVGSIPEGLQLDHLCRRRRCVHPNHTAPLTHVENVMRGRGVGAHNAAKKRCKRGHSDWYVFKRRDGRTYRACRTCILRQQHVKYHQRVS